MYAEYLDGVRAYHQTAAYEKAMAKRKVGGMPQATFLKGIELLRTKVLPQIRTELEQR